QKSTHYSRGSQFDEEYMIKPNLVERIFERHYALYLVRTDHGIQHIVHGKWSLSAGYRRSRQPVGCRQYAPQVIGWMPPLRGQPRVVEVEPPDHRTDIESGMHGVQLIRRTRHFSAIGYDSSRNHRPQ